MKSLALWIVTSSLGRALAQPAKFLTAFTAGGSITGSSCTNSNATTFQSIPYAKPPVGDLRFAAPQAYNTSYVGGSLAATSAAPACIQFENTFIETTPTSEDCLYLDIWVPPNTTATSGLPVKVWIYGGTDAAGGISDPLYNGCNAAEEGNTLVVNVNYRLGPLGWLALEQAGIDGNMGLQDILLALEWIQSNIAAFGGDADQVMLYGQSAGAQNAYIIATLSNSPSLIHSAISESGGGGDVPTAALVQPFMEAYAGFLNRSVNDAACFRSKSASELNATIPEFDYVVVNTVFQQVSFQPFVDGKVIPNAPSEVGVQVPAIFGSTSMEGTVFVLAQYQSPEVTTEDYTKFLVSNFGSALAPTVESYYNVSAFNSTPFPAFFAMAAVTTDYGYKCSANRALSGGIANGVPVWTYLFNHTPSCPWIPGLGTNPEILELTGPAHTSEIPFVFGNVDHFPLPNGNCSFNAAEKAISAAMIEQWSSMAANAHPTSDWPEYTLNESLGLNIINSTLAGRVDYSVCHFWDEIDAALAQQASGVSGSNKSSGNATSTSGSPYNTSGISTASPSAYTGGAATLAGRLVYAVMCAAALGALLAL